MKKKGMTQEENDTLRALIRETGKREKELVGLSQQIEQKMRDGADATDLVQEYSDKAKEYKMPEVIVNRVIEPLIRHKDYDVARKVLDLVPQIVKRTGNTKIQLGPHAPDITTYMKEATDRIQAGQLVTAVKAHPYAEPNTKEWAEQKTTQGETLRREFKAAITKVLDFDFEGQTNAGKTIPPLFKKFSKNIGTPLVAIDPEGLPIAAEGLETLKGETDRLLSSQAARYSTLNPKAQLIRIGDKVIYTGKNDYMLMFPHASKNQIKEIYAHTIGTPALTAIGPRTSGIEKKTYEIKDGKYDGKPLSDTPVYRLKTALDESGGKPIEIFAKDGSREIYRWAPSKKGEDTRTIEYVKTRYKK